MAESSAGISQVSRRDQVIKMQVRELWIYPIKSCQGIPLETSEVTLKGLKWDRELMIVDKMGKFLTQRQEAKLAQIKVQLSSNQLILSIKNNHFSPFQFTPNLAGEKKPVQIWNDYTIAIDQGDQVAEWLQKSLDLEGIRLVRQSPEHIRPIDPNYAQKEDEPVSFSDGYPILITNTASLDELNRRLREIYPRESLTFPMNRFRPNIIVETDFPFLEDQWRQIQIGLIEFAVTKSCSRCIVTTTDQQTGERNLLLEPLRTLSQFRNFRGKILFGENLVPRKTGVLSVGDFVQVLRKR